MVFSLALRRWFAFILGVLVCGALAQSLIPNKIPQPRGGYPSIKATIDSKGIVTLDYTSFARRNEAPKAAVLIYEVPAQEVGILGDQRSVKLASIDRFLIASIKDHRLESNENHLRVKLLDGSVAQFRLRPKHSVYVALKIDGYARALTQVALKTNPVPGNDPIVWQTPSSQSQTAAQNAAIAQGNYNIDKEFRSSNVNQSEYKYYIVAQTFGSFDPQVPGPTPGVQKNVVELTITKLNGGAYDYKLEGRLVFNKTRKGDYVIWVARRKKASILYEQFNGALGGPWFVQSFP